MSALSSHFKNSLTTFIWPNLKHIPKSSFHLISLPFGKHGPSFLESSLDSLCTWLFTHSLCPWSAPPFLPKMLSSPARDAYSPPFLDFWVCFIVLCSSHYSLPLQAIHAIPMTWRVTVCSGYQICLYNSNSWLAFWPNIAACLKLNSVLAQLQIHTCPSISFPLAFPISLKHLISYARTFGVLFDTFHFLSPLLSQIINHQILSSLHQKCSASLPRFTTPTACTLVKASHITLRTLLICSLHDRQHALIFKSPIW